jgi:hypothetical protein
MCIRFPDANELRRRGFSSYRDRGLFSGNLLYCPGRVVFVKSIDVDREGDTRESDRSGPRLSI